MKNNEKQCYDPGMAYIVVTFFLFTISCFGQYYPNQQNNSISVEADAEILVAPNQVEILAGIETNEVTLTEARLENSKRAGAVLAAARKLGIADGDLKTDFFRVEPAYSNRPGERASGPPIRFWVRSNLSITLHDPAKYEELLVAVLDAGATHIHRTSFVNTELRKYRDQARDLAVKAGVEKAKDLAAAANSSISSKPTNIALRGMWDYSSYDYWGNNYGGAAMSQNRSVANEAPGSGSVSLGRISVKASVSLTFTLNP